MRTLFIAALLATPLTLAGCDPNQVGDQTQRAARGTRDAVKNTKLGIDEAQKKAGEMADDINGGKKTPAPTPANDGRPKPTQTPDPLPVSIPPR